MKRVNILLFFRMIVAGIFIGSGMEKLFSPVENFLYVIQNYQVLPQPMMENVLAQIFPWLELLAGVFLALGFWTRYALQGITAMTLTFILVVSQAILRALPIHSCGCFGDLVKVPLPVIVAMDSGILIVTAVLLRYLSRTQEFSLDQYFAKKESDA